MESQEDFKAKTQANLFSIESRPSTLAGLTAAAVVLFRRQWRRRIGSANMPAVQQCRRSETLRG